VENGMLIIEAHKEKFEQAEYTSARLHNSGSGDFLYGKVEVRARIPRGQGTWSAIWMLPSNPYKYATSCASDEDWQGSRTCDAWPFDHPYNVILNLAIGGSWGRTGGPIDASIFPLRMEVDYVRIYQSAE